MNKTSQASNNLFFSYVDEYIRNILKGVEQPVPSFSGSKVYVIDTIAGKLNITLCEEQGYGFSIFSRFSDVERAKAKFDCNPFTGKYNYHTSNKSPFKAFEEVQTHLDCTQS